MFAFPILLGDIGGTNARFAILSGPGAPPLTLGRVLTADFPHPAAAIASVLAGRVLPKPRSALLAIAARVESTIVPLTNAPWTVDAAAIGRALGLQRVVLLNDYVPVAVALAGLAPGDLVSLGAERPAGSGPKLALGPGTGFGAAALVPVEERWAVVSTEAGHAEFGPVDEAEMALWPMLEKVAGRITAETILSGPGLLRLYRALCAARTTQPRCAAPMEVTAMAESDDVARAAVHLFARLLGRYTGDLALIFGATGGAYLSSGIAPDILDVLRRPNEFRAAFEAKAPHADWIATIPTWVVMHRDPALLGLAMLANQPGRFSFANQSWAAGHGAPA